MKTLTLIIAIALVSNSDGFAQKPEWVDNPGAYAAEYFVSVGIAKDKKVDKAREKAEKKALQGIEKVLKSKYKDKEIKEAKPSIRTEAFWQDPANGYYFCLSLLPREAIDKNYAAKKKFEKAKASALDATDNLNMQFKDDVIIINVDED